jgi:hypothetical protein
LKGDVMLIPITRFIPDEGCIVERDFGNTYIKEVMKIRKDDCEEYYIKSVMSSMSEHSN